MELRAAWNNYRLLEEIERVKEEVRGLYEEYAPRESKA
jgi:hypothetical protein